MLHRSHYDVAMDVWHGRSAATVDLDRATEEHRIQLVGTLIREVACGKVILFPRGGRRSSSSEG